jgi:hypothetical protein
VVNGGDLALHVEALADGNTLHATRLPTPSAAVAAAARNRLALERSAEARVTAAEPHKQAATRAIAPSLHPSGATSMSTGRSFLAAMPTR